MKDTKKVQTEQSEVMCVRGKIIKAIILNSEIRYLEIIERVAMAVFRHGASITSPNTEDLNHAIQVIEQLKEEETEHLETVTEESLLKQDIIQMVSDSKDVGNLRSVQTFARELLL